MHVSLSLSTNWEISNDNWGSDHFPIFIHINCQTIPPSSLFGSNRRYSKNINWVKFKDRVHVAFEENKSYLQNISDLNIKYSSFMAIISDALTYRPPSKSSKGLANRSSTSSESNNQMPHSSLSRRSPPCEWWDTEYERLVRLRKASWLKFH